MNQPKKPPQVSEALPTDARNRLVAASKVGEPGSDERNKAIDDAIHYVKMFYHYRFKQGALQ